MRRLRDSRLHFLAGGLATLPLAMVIAISAGSQGGAAPPQVDGCCSTPLANRGGAEMCLTQQFYELNNPQMDPGSDSACSSWTADDPVFRDSMIPNELTPVKTYRVVIHVLCEDNGANPAIPQGQVDFGMSTANAQFAPWKIQFVYETRFRNSTRYRYLDSNEVTGMKRAFAESPATKLNVFVTTYNPGIMSWGTFPWDANSLTAQGGIVMHRGMFGNPFVAHEIGHCVGLWHTFHGVTEVAQCSVCYEPAGRSVEVGDNTGDFCSDTNPTTNHGACADPGGTDACTGNPWTNTPYTNFMGYSNSCSNAFTPQQAGRMHAWTETHLRGWIDPVPPNAPGTPTLTKLGGLTVQIDWADNSADEDNFQVQRERKSGSQWIEQQIVATVGFDVTRVNDTVPVAGTYRYRVRATNANGPSAWTAWAQVKL